MYIIPQKKRVTNLEDKVPIYIKARKKNTKNYNSRKCF